MFSAPAGAGNLPSLTSRTNQIPAENSRESAQTFDFPNDQRRVRTAPSAGALDGELAQSVSASVLHTEGSGFEFRVPHQYSLNPEAARSRSRREYLRNYGRAWIRRRRTEWFADKCCDRCPATSSLELHHRNPDHKVSHSIWSWSQARRKVELNKCVVLCGDCHKKLTALDAGRRTVSEPRLWAIGSSGYPNVTWSSQKHRWRVTLEFQGRGVSAGHFRNPLTASMSAERLRTALAKRCARQNILAQVSCVKQLSLGANF